MHSSFKYIYVSSTLSKSISKSISVSARMRNLHIRIRIFCRCECRYPWIIIILLHPYMLPMQITNFNKINRTIRYAWSVYNYNLRLTGSWNSRKTQQSLQKSKNVNTTATIKWVFSELIFFSQTKHSSKRSRPPNKIMFGILQEQGLCSLVDWKQNSYPSIADSMFKLVKNLFWLSGISWPLSF